MLHTQDIYELNEITALLARGLASSAGDLSEVPYEVVEALNSAQQQMENLPEVINDLNRALGSYLSLSSALGRMSRLAAEAAETEVSEERLHALEEEFIGLAKVVALEAGRQFYQGPHLSLLSPGQAAAAAKVLGYLNPVLENLRHELAGQKEIIHEVIDETVSFLGVLVHCYPHVAGLRHLSGVIESIEQYRNVHSGKFGPSLH